MSIAIVGGGLAAATAATELRERGYDGDVVIYAAEDHLPYERPPLSKDVLLGTKDIDSAIVQDEGWYTANRVRLERGVAVTAIDAARTPCASSRSAAARNPSTSTTDCCWPPAPPHVTSTSPTVSATRCTCARSRTTPGCAPRCVPARRW